MVIRNQKIKKAKIKSYRYPYDRIENDMDYLRIKVAQYRAPLADGFPDDIAELNIVKDDKGKVSTAKLEGTENTVYGVKTSGLKRISESTGSRSNRESLKKPNISNGLADSTTNFRYQCDRLDRW